MGGSLSVQVSDNPVTVAEAIFMGPGISVEDAEWLNHAEGSSGTFTGGPFGIGSGSIVTSGEAKSAELKPGSNTDVENGAGNWLDCDPDSYDVSALYVDIEITEEWNGVQIEYILASDEYTYKRPDKFGIYLDGIQYARDPTDAVELTAQSRFFSPDVAIIGQNTSTAYAAAAPPLIMGVDTYPGQHSMIFAVCDIIDGRHDSALFVKVRGCVNCEEPARINYETSTTTVYPPSTSFTSTIKAFQETSGTVVIGVVERSTPTSERTTESTPTPSDSPTTTTSTFDAETSSSSDLLSTSSTSSLDFSSTTVSIATSASASTSASTSSPSLSGSVTDSTPSFSTVQSTTDSSTISLVPSEGSGSTTSTTSNADNSSTASSAESSTRSADESDSSTADGPATTTVTNASGSVSAVPDGSLLSTLTPETPITDQESTSDASVTELASGTTKETSSEIGTASTEAETLSSPMLSTSVLDESLVTSLATTVSGTILIRSFLSDKANVFPISIASASPAAASNLLVIGQYAYLGCLSSSDGYPTFSLVASSDDMTPSACILIAEGQPYIGVHGRCVPITLFIHRLLIPTLRNCYAAGSLDSTTLTEGGLCDELCPGNSNLFCGGLVDSDSSIAARRFNAGDFLETRDAPADTLLSLYGLNGEVSNLLSADVPTGISSSDLGDATADSTISMSVPTTPALSPDISSMDLPGRVSSNNPGIPSSGWINTLNQTIRTQDLASPATTVVTMVYTIVDPSNPSYLTVTEYCATMEYTPCQVCAEQSVPTVEMTTIERSCDACGYHDENTIVLTVPAGAITEPSVTFPHHETEPEIHSGQAPVVTTKLEQPSTGPEPIEQPSSIEHSDHSVSLDDNGSSDDSGLPAHKVNGNSKVYDVSDSSPTNVSIDAVAASQQDHPAVKLQPTNLDSLDGPDVLKLPQDSSSKTSHPQEPSVKLKQARPTVLGDVSRHPEEPQVTDLPERVAPMAAPTIQQPEGGKLLSTSTLVHLDAPSTGPDSPVIVAAADKTTWASRVVLFTSAFAIGALLVL
ncbi:hypothetical protein FALBO_8795 [Fusarium albosuccineum]|uniref:WSC domain-containing protein n=1 Tax=Fusarium albosuccineum TaxID=1237068 RepID=A0A8H4L7N2_9HYPO|nr:hypothetical protein FALBO_8795 [Fusarium albosuccineum]